MASPVTRSNVMQSRQHGPNLKERSQLLVESMPQRTEPVLTAKGKTKGCYCVPNKELSECVFGYVVAYGSQFKYII